MSVLPTQALQKLREDAAMTRRELNQKKRELEVEAGVHTSGERAAIKRIGDQVKYSPGLYPWMRAYAEWLTLECVTVPSQSSRMGKVRALARAPINIHYLKTLEARPDFVAYVRDLESGPLERARRRFERAYPEYVEAHHDALQQARDAGDYNAVARIAEPVLDRIAPKRAENAAAAQVTVVLAPEQVKAIATYEAPLMLVAPTKPDAETP